MNQPNPSDRRSTNRRSFMARTGLLAAGSLSLLSVSQLLALSDRADRARVKPRGPQANNFAAILRHENDHVAYLVNALGANARPKPTFQNLLQPDYKEFVLVAQTLENTGVGAYLGAAPYINDSGILAAAGSIATVEARHAGYLNTSLNDPVTATALDDQSGLSFETPFSPEQVAAGAGPFIADLNGGPDVTYSTIDVSDANDLAILNFALALEYLEAEYYNLNFAKYFPNYFK